MREVKRLVIKNTPGAPGCAFLPGAFGSLPKSRTANRGSLLPNFYFLVSIREWRFFPLTRRLDDAVNLARRKGRRTLARGFFADSSQNRRRLVNKFCAPQSGLHIPHLSVVREKNTAGETCKLALALQRQFERFRKIRFGLFDGFALRNRGRNLFPKAGIATLFGGFKNGCQFHASRLSHPAIGLAGWRAPLPKKAFSGATCPDPVAGISGF